MYQPSNPYKMLCNDNVYPNTLKLTWKTTNELLAIKNFLVRGLTKPGIKEKAIEGKIIPKPKKRP